MESITSHIAYMHCQVIEVFVYSLLEDRYSFVSPCSLMLCQCVSPFVKHSLAFLLKAERFSDAAHDFLILGLIVFRFATCAAWMWWPGRFWGALLLGIGRLLWGQTVLLSCRKWCSVTSTILSGWWWACTSALFCGSWWYFTSPVVGGHCGDRTGIILGGHWRTCTGRCYLILGR